jgi:TatD DNase family protein
LDGSEEYRSSFTLQQSVLNQALAACSAHGGRIISLHSRRAAKPVLDALEAHPRCGTPVLHWFSGSLAELRRAIELGCWFSVGPKMLESDRGYRLVAAMPRDRILTETDGPFAKSKTGPLMPWDVKKAERVLANLWKCGDTTVQRTLRQNLRNLVDEEGSSH